MIQKIARVAKWMAAIAIVAMTIGCSGKSDKAAEKAKEGVEKAVEVRRDTTVVAENLGLTMELPKGWQLSEGSTKSFFDKKRPGQNTGKVESFPLKEGTLGEFVNNRLKKAQIAVKNPMTVGEYEALEVVSTAGGFTTLSLYIQKDDRVILVYFKTLGTDFPEQEPSLHKALRTIKLGQKISGQRGSQKSGQEGIQKNKKSSHKSDVEGILKEE